MSRLCRLVTLTCISFVSALTFADAQTTPSPTFSCASRSNTTCDECLKNVICLWCITTQQCIDYPVRSILPSHNLCPLPDARWGLCWLNFQALIIAVSVVAGVIILAIFVCCCCCCKCSDRNGNKREDAKVERQAQARKSRQEERRTEMKLRHDEIRQKYGLAKGNPYSRMENN